MTECEVSWLVLERHALGEPLGMAVEAFGAHVGQCPRCRARLEQIHGDRRPLRPLRAPRDRSVRWIAAIGWALAAAAAGLFALRPAAPPPDATKGDGWALTLVRDRDGEVTEDPAEFEVGDRFSVWVTCPRGAGPFQVYVRQGQAVAAPLELPPDFPCGNQVALDGAFRLDGSETAEVCLSRDRLEVVCVTVEHAEGR